MRDSLLGKRRAKQPLELPSAGSTFQRPVGNYASFLIDQCGLKGASVGDAQVSVKHAGFVVNTGKATCRDVLELCDFVKQTVLEKTGPGAGVPHGNLAGPRQPLVPFPCGKGTRASAEVILSRIL